MPFDISSIETLNVILWITTDFLNALALLITAAAAVVFATNRLLVGIKRAASLISMIRRQIGRSSGKSTR